MQKDEKVLYVATRIFIFILIIVFFSVIIKYGIDKYNNNIGTKEEKIESIADYLNWLDKKEQTIEDYSSKYLAGYNKIIELQEKYKSAIKWDLIRLEDGGTPVNIGNGMISEIKNKKDNSARAQKLIEFNNYLEEKGINLLYVQAPSKTDNVATGGTLNIKKDYIKENTDNFLEKLTKERVDILDLRQEIIKENLKSEEIFFKTDHHWKPKTGIWATKKVANKLNELYNFNINTDMYNITNYEIRTIPKIALGSEGKRATLAKVELEDFDIILPKFKNNLNVEIPSKNICKEGSISDTAIDWTRIKREYYNTEVYAAYGYGNPPLIKVKKDLANDSDKNILIIKDSFANVVWPYLSLAMNNTYVLDLRYYGESLKQFIAENKIDAVIMLYYPASLEDSNMFNFE